MKLADRRGGKDLGGARRSEKRDQLRGRPKRSTQRNAQRAAENNGRDEGHRDREQERAEHTVDEPGSAEARRRERNAGDDPENQQKAEGAKKGDGRSHSAEVAFAACDRDVEVVLPSRARRRRAHRLWRQEQ